MRVGLGLALLWFASVFAIFGGIFCLWAGYEYLTSVLDHALAVLIMGVCAIAVAGVCVWVARRLTR